MRIETIDDKYLYDNIFRFETDEDVEFVKEILGEEE